MTRSRAANVAKTILLTGAAGFIGSHTADLLLARGDKVVGLDDFNDYYSPAQKRRNVELVRGGSHPGELLMIEGDIRDEALVDEIFREHRFDVIIHLAAMAGVRASIARPRRYLDVNVGGTLNLLQATARFGMPHVVVASTSSVYGLTREIPFIESDPCDTPLAPYAATKRAAELLAFTHHHLHAGTVTVLRFFTVYGPRNRPDMMAFKILDSVLNGTEVPLYAGGEMWRDWTFVSDIARGVVAAADRPLGHATFNIGRGEPIRLADFVSRLEALAGGPANVKSAPRPETDVVKTWADVSQLRARLDYAPSVSLEEGTSALWQWYQREHM
jgi:UDP-glucuronate 4-epimerase